MQNACSSPWRDELERAYGHSTVGEKGHSTEGHDIGDADFAAALTAGASLQYGELLPESASRLWRELGLPSSRCASAASPAAAPSPPTASCSAPASSTVVLELGMGTGKLALQAFIELRGAVARVVGGRAPCDGT